MQDLFGLKSKEYPCCIRSQQVIVKWQLIWFISGLHSTSKVNLQFLDKYSQLFLTVNGVNSVPSCKIPEAKNQGNV